MVKYVDSSVVSSGDGNSEATAYKTLADLPSSGLAGQEIRIRCDGVVIRPSSTIPTNLTSTNYGRSFSNTEAGITFTTYGTGDPILSGGVLWTGSVGEETINGLLCKTILHSAQVSPYWFPRSDGRASYPTVCAPTSDNAVDTFAADATAFDNIEPGISGVRYCPALNYGGTSDSTKEVSYTDRGAGYSPSSARYAIKIKAPGFWARANAVESVVGHHMVMRTGTNFTKYFIVIESYDAVDGSVIAGSASAPSNGSTGNFFYALFGHKYGIRLNRHYAMIMDSGVAKGWVFNLPDGELDIVCYQTIFRFLGDNISFDTEKTWNVDALAVGNAASGAGCFARLEQGVSTFSIGPVVARQVRSFDRNGAPVQGSGSGAISNLTMSSVEVQESLGCKLIELSPTGGGSTATITGPGYSEEGGGGVRVAGSITGVTISDQVITPRPSVHENAANIYQAAKDVELNGIVVVGNVNPFATQWNVVNAESHDNVNRRVINSWFGARPKIDRSGWLTNATFRHDDGNKNGLYRRVFAAGSYSIMGNDGGTKPNTGLVVERCILDNFYISQANAASGVTFRHCVFAGRASAISGSYATIKAHIEAFGGTVENCVELANPYAGVLTNDMWDKLTLTDDYSGHEAISQWLAPQLGLSLPAYGGTRTIVAPKLIPVPLRVGGQAYVMIAGVLNPNPLGVMSLPAGVGDNDKLLPTLYGGQCLIPSVAIPNQSVFQVVIDVADAGASNGPTQRFTYNLPIESFAEGTRYGPFTLSVDDDSGQTASLEPFYITVQP